MLSFEDFKNLSIDEAYTAYRDKCLACDLFSMRCADLNKRVESMWASYCEVYLYNKH